MDASTFDTFLSQIGLLSSQQCAHVLTVLKGTVDKARTVDIIQAAVLDKLACPRCQGRFHGWLRPFRGVATRYLPNYLGWRWAIDQERIRSPETFLEAAIGVFHS